MGKPHVLFDVKTNSNDQRNHYVPAADGMKFLVLSQQEQDRKGLDAIVNWPELLKGVNAPTASSTNLQENSLQNQ